MIPVQNIYYMLAYAFQVLNENGYKDIATEQFDNVGELCAAILAKGVSIQLKRGLGKEYIPRTEAPTQNVSRHCQMSSKGGGKITPWLGMTRLEGII